MSITSEQARAAGKKGGRPKGSVSLSTRLQMEMKEALFKHVNKYFVPLLEANTDLALGTLHADNPVFDETTGKMIRAKIYKKDPDGGAIRYMFDQTIGKAKETVEHTGNITGILQLVADLEKE